MVFTIKEIIFIVYKNVMIKSLKVGKNVSVMNFWRIAHPIRRPFFVSLKNLTRMPLYRICLMREPKLF